MLLVKKARGAKRAKIKGERQERTEGIKRERGTEVVEGGGETLLHQNKDEEDRKTKKNLAPLELFKVALPPGVLVETRTKEKPDD